MPVTHPSLSSTGDCTCLTANITTANITTANITERPRPPHRATIPIFFTPYFVCTVSATARAHCNALQQGALEQGALCLALMHVRPWLCQRRLQLSTHTPTCFKHLTGPIPDRHGHVHQLGCADHSKCHCRHPACILLLTSLVEQPSGSHVAITCVGFRV